VDCYRGLNLLGHAQLEELPIGSRCGGHGVCGGDRVRVASQDFAKLSPPTEAERRHLSAEEIHQGWRLACQCWPASDGLSLELEVEFQPPPEGENLKG
jgi:ferredoxin